MRCFRDFAGCPVLRLPVGVSRSVNHGFIRQSTTHAVGKTTRQQNKGPKPHSICQEIEFPVREPARTAIPFYESAQSVRVELLMRFVETGAEDKADVKQRRP